MCSDFRGARGHTFVEMVASTGMVCRDIKTNLPKGSYASLLVRHGLLWEGVAASPGATGCFDPVVPAQQSLPSIL